MYYRLTFFSGMLNDEVAGPDVGREGGLDEMPGPGVRQRGQQVSVASSRHHVGNLKGQKGFKLDPKPVIPILMYII